MLKKIAVLLVCVVSCIVAKIEEKQLQLIITSYNNADWYKKNLDSVVMQNYSNYRVLYIDDCSTDNTAALVEQYMVENNLKDTWTLIKNDTWKSQMANHYTAVQMCDDDVICVHLDGDDWLAHENVFNVINETYEDPDIWITAGRPIFSCSGQKWSKMPEEILENAIKNNRFRSLPFWPFTHLRTFRASLFKAIKLQDLLYRGTFTLMSPAPDLAFMLPMVEMAARHIKILDNDLYVYNTKNALSQFTLNNEKVLSLTSEIYSWEPYQPIDSLQKTIHKVGDAKFSALLLLSGDKKTDFDLCYEISKRDYHIVICLYSSNYSEENLIALQQQFPHMVFFEDSENFNSDLEEYVKNMDDYILVVSSEYESICNNDMKLARESLERTRADSCIFSPIVNIDSQETRIIKINDHVYACQPNFAQDLIAGYASSAGIFRKKNVEQYLHEKEKSRSLIMYLSNIGNYISHDRTVQLIISSNP